jgi:hypothetical protein
MDFNELKVSKKYDEMQIILTSWESNYKWKENRWWGSNIFP